MTGATSGKARAFRFGIVAPFLSDPPAWRDQVRRIADHGYSTVLMPDFPRLQPSPAPALAVAATVADVRVGTWVYAAPLRAPWLTAWEAHSLTVLAADRRAGLAEVPGRSGEVPGEPERRRQARRRRQHPAGAAPPTACLAVCGALGRLGHPRPRVNHGGPAEQPGEPGPPGQRLTAWGTWVYAAPLRAPWLTAWEAHSLTVLTQGRFEMGIRVGRPGIEDELRERGLPAPSPGQRLGRTAVAAGSLQLPGGAARRPRQSSSSPGFGSLPYSVMNTSRSSIGGA